MSSDGKATVLLQHYLKQLRLPSILREHEKLAVVCQQERADYQTYLLRLVELETADRERRAAECTPGPAPAVTRAVRAPPRAPARGA